MRILRDEIVRLGVDVSKVTPPTARDDDLASDLSIALEDGNTLAALPGGNGAKESCCTPADNDRVKDHDGSDKYFSRKID